MASLTQWAWVWVNSGSWWWTGRHGMLWFMGSQRVGQYWATELNWNNREEKQLLSTENWIKVLLSIAPPIRTRPSCSLVQFLHSEASISLLSFIRGQTENHNHRKLTNLVTWSTALSNSVKLWTMPCRATQDGWDMVKSSDKMGSIGGGMANYFSVLALRTPWRVWKGKKIGHWKMNSPGQ